MINRVFKWVIRHKTQTAFICFGLFFLPLIIVHFLFKYSSGIELISAEWSAGDIIGYIAGFEAFLGTAALGAVALWQNRQIHDQHIESLEPILTMKLIVLNGFLYLIIENTGATEAKEIKLTINSIKNNGESCKLYLDELCDFSFELYPKEVVQGRIASSGENIGTQIFPQINVAVSYLRPDINRSKEYSRNVIYSNGYTNHVTAAINMDNGKIESDADCIARAIVRIANYLDGCQVAKFDELNILAGKSLRNDIVNAIKTKEEVDVSSRQKTIEKYFENSLISDK